jgi:hypothetical protein
VFKPSSPLFYTTGDKKGFQTQPFHSVTPLNVRYLLPLTPIYTARTFPGAEFLTDSLYNTTNDLVFAFFKSSLILVLFPSVAGEAIQNRNAPVDFFFFEKCCC